MVIYLKYTTIRISIEDRERLRRLAKLTGHDSLAAALRYALDIAEKSIERKKGDVKKVFKSLKYAKNIGRTDATLVDKYLYGEHSDSYC